MKKSGLKIKYSLHYSDNLEIYNPIGFPDDDPLRVRPVHFYFFADHKRQLLKLAAKLRSYDFKIDKIIKSYSGQWLCLALRDLAPYPDVMNRFAVLMMETAEKFGVDYDGWETIIEA